MWGFAWMRLISGFFSPRVFWYFSLQITFTIHCLEFIAETYRPINLQMISITIKKTFNPILGTHTFQIQHCSTFFNIPVQIQFNKGTKNKFFTSLVLCKRMNGKSQSKHQAWGALVESHHWFQCSQCMSVSVGGTEVMSRGDSAVIGCLWEEAILLASGSRSVSMWISLTENMWKDVQMERQEERETESLANVHGQLYLSEPFPKSSFKGKTNCCEGKESGGVQGQPTTKRMHKRGLG